MAIENEPKKFFRVLRIRPKTAAYRSEGTNKAPRKGDHDDEQSHAAGEPQNEVHSPADRPECYQPWLNSEGYHDPTAYEAHRRIERLERGERITRVAL